MDSIGISAATEIHRAPIRSRLCNVYKPCRIAGIPPIMKKIRFSPESYCIIGAKNRVITKAEMGEADDGLGGVFYKGNVVYFNSACCTLNYSIVASGICLNNMNNLKIGDIVKVANG